MLNRCVGVAGRSVLALGLWLGSAGPALALDPVLDAGTQRWVEAASAGRADVLMLGDSTVLSQGHGWDAGLTAAASRAFGIAGTTLFTGQATGHGEGYALGGSFSGDWLSNDASAFGDPSTYGAFGHLTTAGATPAQLGVVIDGSTLDPAHAYDLQLWVAGGTGGGSYTVERRLGESPWTRASFLGGQSAPETATVASPVHRLAATTQGSAQVRLFVDNATVMGVRVLDADAASGVTLTAQGVNGASALDLYTSRWTNRTPAGRAAYLDRLVEGGSGELMVPLFVGLNDLAETEPSVHGITDGGSTAAYLDNVDALIDVIRADWLAGGHDAADLSFVTFGSYEVASSASNAALADYAAGLAAYAAGEEGVSFVDLSELGPSYSDGVAAGYYFDGIHLSRAGAMFYGEQIMQTLVPEPGTAGVLVALLLTGAMRRRRQKTIGE